MTYCEIALYRECSNWNESNKAIIKSKLFYSSMNIKCYYARWTQMGDIKEGRLKLAENVIASLPSALFSKKPSAWAKAAVNFRLNWRIYHRVKPKNSIRDSIQCLISILNWTKDDLKANKKFPLDGGMNEIFALEAQSAICNVERSGWTINSSDIPKTWNGKGSASNWLVTSPRETFIIIYTAAAAFV